MLTIQSNDAMGRAKRALSVFRRQFPVLFRQLFCESRPIKHGGELLYPIEDVGLVERDSAEWRSSFVVSAFRDLFVVTDSFTRAQRDRVFPLSNDESLFLARK